MSAPETAGTDVRTARPDRGHDRAPTWTRCSATARAGCRSAPSPRRVLPTSRRTRRSSRPIGELAAKTLVQAEWAADAGMALYAVPGTVATPGEARAEDVAQTQVVLIDLDHGDIGAKRAHLVRHLGEPSLEVASGGVTAEGQAKLHLYWRLTEPAEGEDIARVCRLRHMIAVKAGGDPSFRSAHQPIRVAGSVYRKNGTAAAGADRRAAAPSTTTSASLPRR